MAKLYAGDTRESPAHRSSRLPVCMAFTSAPNDSGSTGSLMSSAYNRCSALTVPELSRVPDRWSIERLGIILHRSGNQPTLAGVANSSPAEPLDRDITGFGEFQQVLEP